MNSLDLNIRQY